MKSVQFGRVARERARCSLFLNFLSKQTSFVVEETRSSPKKISPKISPKKLGGAAKNVGLLHAACMLRPCFDAFRFFHTNANQICWAHDLFR